MRIKLRDELRKTVPTEVVAKRALYATKCDACGKEFDMGEWCNENHDGRRGGQLHGTFDKSSREDGNIFSADVCSFRCAHKLFAADGWKALKGYAWFKTHGAVLVRVELRLTALVRSGKELTSAWEASEAERR